MNSHANEEDFALLDARTLKPIPLPVEIFGSSVTVSAHGPGDITSVSSVSRAASGESMRPLSPAHLRAVLGPDGSLTVNWVRRSRLAWGWMDEIESPPDPSLQGYRVRVAGISLALERDCAGEQAVFNAAEVASLGSGLVEVHVRQIGTLLLSRPEIFLINA
jgi:hypothetical protein